MTCGAYSKLLLSPCCANSGSLSCPEGVEIKRFRITSAFAGEMPVALNAFNMFEEVKETSYAGQNNGKKLAFFDRY
jgi:hypothetical protein